jgi:hypothetical protein
MAPGGTTGDRGGHRRLHRRQQCRRPGDGIALRQRPAEQVAAVDRGLQALGDLVDRRLGRRHDVDPLRREARRREGLVLYGERGVVDGGKALVHQLGADREIADVVLEIVDQRGLVAQADVERRLGTEIAVALRLLAGRNLRLQLLDAALKRLELAAQKIALAEGRKRRHGSYSRLIRRYWIAVNSVANMSLAVCSTRALAA